MECHYYRSKHVLKMLPDASPPKHNRSLDKKKYEQKTSGTRKQTNAHDRSNRIGKFSHAPLGGVVEAFRDGSDGVLKHDRLRLRHEPLPESL